MLLRAAFAIGLVTYLAAQAEHGAPTAAVVAPAYGERLALAFCQEAPTACAHLALEATRGLRSTGARLATAAAHRPADAADRYAAALAGSARRMRQEKSPARD
jgi:hypothetical protein